MSLQPDAPSTVVGTLSGIVSAILFDGTGQIIYTAALGALVGFIVTKTLEHLYKKFKK